MNEIENKLDTLADCYAQRDALMLQKCELKDAATPVDVKDRLEAIDQEFPDIEKAAAEKIVALEAEIKAATLAQGETVKGSSMMAVWNKGRVSWNTSQLDGLALVIPDLLKARTVGDPSVTIRRR